MSGPSPDVPSAPEPQPIGPPQRPSFTSGLPEREEVPTPRAVGVVRWSVWASVVAFAAPTALAGLRQAELRETLRTELAERATDYSASEIGQAVTLTLVAVGVIGVVFTLLELMAMSALRQRRSGARPALMALIVLHLPVLVVTTAFRGTSSVDLAFTAAQALFLLTATVAVVLPVTKEWLHAKPPLAVRSLLVPQEAASHPERPRPAE